jgi:hypothetical protein
MEIIKLSPSSLKKHLYQLIYLIYSFLRWNYFYLNNKKINYENSFYNTSFFNERSVEIPLIKELLNNYDTSNFLEIGNVLMHYNFIKSRDIVDKYEVSEEVLNFDIEDYRDKKYSLIVSISTLEHVGLDAGEEIIDNQKLQRCVSNIIENLLIEKGVFIVTLPVNYNQNVDKFIFENDIFQEKFYMVKNNLFLNTWKKLEFDEVKARYRKKPILIEEVFIGIYTKI